MGLRPGIEPGFYISLKMESNHMASKTSGQFGEYTVAAELSRRGLVATTFTRNMEGFDILAINTNTNKSFRVQVKTITSGEWSFQANNYLYFDEETLEKKGKQIITGVKQNNKADYIVLVKRGNERREDKFFILRYPKFVELLKDKYEAFLKRIGGKRPRTPKAMHETLDEADLAKYLENWGVFST